MKAVSAARLRKLKRNRRMTRNLLRVFQGGMSALSNKKEYPMFGSKEQARIINELTQRVSALESALRQNRREAVKSHDRIDQANLRVANIEHYIGMRSHSFNDGGRMWNYMQLHKDIKNGQRPQSLFVAKSRVQAA